MNKGPDLATQRWNQEYLSGKYDGEGPVPFVADILATLEDAGLTSGSGLYIGCGNGRNYIPLIDAGLTLTGLDISEEAIQQIQASRPASTNPLACADFFDYQSSEPFDYIVSLQVFQHGTQEEITKHFAKTTDLLKPGGIFFLRVNSTATQIFHEHRAIETSTEGGETIEYLAGPKTGLNIHFYTKAELEHLTQDVFQPIAPLTEKVMDRKPPQTGQWAQWEGIWRKQ